MRELKFRVYLNEDNLIPRQKGTHKVTAITWAKEAPSFYLSAFDGYVARYDHPRLMQYTGLKDKNGVEIYEGDIVEASAWWENSESIKKSVEYIDGMFGIRWPEHQPGIFKLTAFKCEVVGNIYENPELLTKE